MRSVLRPDLRNIPTLFMESFHSLSRFQKVNLTRARRVKPWDSPAEKTRAVGIVIK